MGLILRQAALIAAKDTKIFVRDRFALGFSFLFPLMFVLGFTLAMGDVGPEDEQLQLTVATLEDEGITRQIIDSLAESTEFSIQEMAYEEALQAVEDEDLAGFVAFPSDFTANLISGKPTSLEVVANADNPGDGAALVGLAQAIAGGASNTVIAVRGIIDLKIAEGGGIPEFPPESLEQEAAELIGFETVQVAEIESFNASSFTLPGYLTMFVFFAASLSAMAIARERQTQTLERLMSNGVRRESVVFGKYLGAAYKGLMQLAVLWLVGVLAFKIDLGASPLAVILISLLMVLASSGFGVMLASIVRTENSANSVAVLCSLALAALGGSWWPLFITPQWMQSLAKVTPHAWANTGFNKLMLFGAEFGDVYLEMLALVVFGVVFVIVALLRFRLSEAH